MSMDSFGDRMKAYERRECDRRAIPFLPVYARIDGRTFSRFTRGLRRPYDERLCRAMIEVTKYLVENTNAKIGYTQSDEISLVWIAEEIDQTIFFDGRYQKMASVLAGMATAKFIHLLTTSDDPEFAAYADRLPHFDARVCEFPNKREAANMFLWREMDATKNAVSMAARCYFSHASLQGLSSAAMQERLFQEEGINFNDYPAFFKRGTFVRRAVVKRPLTETELARIPPEKRPASDQLFDRAEIVELDMPPFSKVINRVEVIFDGAMPQTANTIAVAA